jgi:hypothetical protein
MGTTLYVLRQHPNRISSAIFRSTDAQTDVVFVEQAISKAPSSVNGFVVTTEETVVGFSHPTMTYDEFVEKIFSSEHIIVV